MFKQCLCLLLAHLPTSAIGFFVSGGVSGQRVGLRATSRAFSSHATELSSMGLPTKLKDMVAGLRSLPDDKMRVRQVLFMAGKGADMEECLKVSHNKVPGCLSTVYVNARLDPEGRLRLQGWSDSQLTKGLVTLLVDGLSGCTPAEMQSVQPDFIQYCGLGASLTPGCVVVRLALANRAPFSPLVRSQEEQWVSKYDWDHQAQGAGA